MILENKLLIDFHNHSLPNMDDGAKDANESIKMIEEASKNNIDVLFFTSHFYADEEYPSDYILRREKAFNLIKDRISPSIKYCFGAEVAYFTGIGLSQEILKLTLNGSKYILVELPYYTEITKSILDDILNLKKKSGLNIILAHIHRYFDFGLKKHLDYLKDNGVLFQWNAEAFISKREHLKYLDKGFVDILGSDAHNLTSRPQNLLDAVNVIKEYNMNALNRIIDIQNKVISNISNN